MKDRYKGCNCGCGQALTIERMKEDIDHQLFLLQTLISTMEVGERDISLKDIQAQVLRIRKSMGFVKDEI